MRHCLSFLFVVFLLGGCNSVSPLRESASVVQSRPRIQSVFPNSGPLSGGNTITINGSNFVSGARVQIQGVECPNSYRLSANQITCTPLRRKAGTYHVRVINPDGQMILLKSAYTYRSDPPLIDHGVASKFSSAWGTFATTDLTGKNWISVWLSDHRGCDSLLNIDASSGATSLVSLLPPRGRQAPVRSLLSSKDKIYALFGGRFYEYDLQERRITFQESIQLENQVASYWETAMGMTESDDGLIWMSTWPYSNLYAFNPETKQLMRYGRANEEQWLQYPGYLAADSSGWIYIGIGTSLSQITAFNPRGNGQFVKLLSSSERVQGSGYVYADIDGNVYGLAEGGQKTGWYRFFGGSKTLLEGRAPNRKKNIKSGFQDFIINDFKDGSNLTQIDLIARKLHLKASGGAERLVSFDYGTDGAGILSVASTNSGSLCGSTGFPMRLFCFDPRMRSWTNIPSAGQINVFAKDGNNLFIGGYPDGSLAQWNPSPPTGGEPSPLVSKSSYPILRRPHELLVTPDGNSIILAGTPGYGLTGGGLVIWDKKSSTPKEIPHTEILPLHSTMSFVSLPNGKIIGGSTIRAGTGGVNKAPEAVLYEWDLTSQRVTWQRGVIPRAHTYSDLTSTSDSKVLGIADGRHFFVFDPNTVSLIRNENLQQKFGTMTVSEQSQQGPRVFAKDSNGVIYLLLQNGIVKVDPVSYQTTKLVDVPVSITGGGDFLGGRLYFFSGSHLYSYLPAQ